MAKNAAMKMMERLDVEHGIPKGDIVRALKIDGYRRFYREVMDDGWSMVRKLPSDREFDRGLAGRMKKAQFAANVIDFFCSSPVVSIRGKQKRTSLSIAHYIVRDAQKRGKTKSKADWREFASQAVLVHLLLVQKFELLPPKIATTSFADKLLDQARDIDHLAQFFAAYNFVLTKLAGSSVRTGKPLKPTEKIKLPSYTINYDPPKAEIQTLLDEYNSAEH